ncbi:MULTISPECIES: hypothetical protein [unclassified Sphingomonas]|uniref:hypothetical protein n=2 Tax=unclassified Sphingomonas TaxID=196159 RepID=UPI0008363DAD|nr:MULTISPECIES: hypothetical protein [unclassified Sphingomonas]
MRGYWMAPMLLIAGCESSPDVARNDMTETTLNYQAEVAKLNEGQRNGVMIRAIRDAGIACQGVTATVPIGSDSPGVWRATCQDGASHVIQINPDGSANVVSAAAAGDAPAAGAPES